MKYKAYDKLRMQYMVWVNGIDKPLLCTRCGDDDITHLTVGHLDNDGSVRARRIMGVTGPGLPMVGGGSKGPRGTPGSMTFQLIARLKELGWPNAEREGLALECYNCNNAKRSTFRGYTHDDILHLRAIVEGEFRAATELPSRRDMFDHLPEGSY